MSTLQGTGLECPSPDACPSTWSGEGKVQLLPASLSPKSLPLFPRPPCPQTLKMSEEFYPLRSISL